MFHVQLSAPEVIGTGVTSTGVSKGGNLSHTTSSTRSSHVGVTHLRLPLAVTGSSPVTFTPTAPSPVTLSPYSNVSDQSTPSTKAYSSLTVPSPNHSWLQPPNTTVDLDASLRGSVAIQQVQASLAQDHPREHAKSLLLQHVLTQKKVSGQHSHRPSVVATTHHVVTRKFIDVPVALRGVYDELVHERPHGMTWEQQEALNKAAAAATNVQPTVEPIPSAAQPAITTTPTILQLPPTSHQRQRSRARGFTRMDSISSLDSFKSHSDSTSTIHTTSEPPPPSAVAPVVPPPKPVPPPTPKPKTSVLDDISYHEAKSILKRHTVLELARAGEITLHADLDEVRVAPVPAVLQDLVQKHEVEKRQMKEREATIKALEIEAKKQFAAKSALEIIQDTSMTPELLKLRQELKQIEERNKADQAQFQQHQLDVAEAAKLESERIDQFCHPSFNSTMEVTKPKPLVPFSLQGDLELYSHVNVERRISNKFHPSFVHRVQQFWLTCEGHEVGRHAQMVVPRGNFIKMLLLIYQHLHQEEDELLKEEEEEKKGEKQTNASPYTPGSLFSLVPPTHRQTPPSTPQPSATTLRLAELHQSLTRDIQLDLRGSGSSLTFVQFHESLFQLIDHWTLTTELKEYLLLLDSIYAAITRPKTEAELNFRKDGAFDYPTHHSTHVTQPKPIRQFLPTKKTTRWMVGPGGLPIQSTDSDSNTSSPARSRKSTRPSSHASVRPSSSKSTGTPKVEAETWETAERKVAPAPILDPAKDSLAARMARRATKLNDQPMPTSKQPSRNPSRTHSPHSPTSPSLPVALPSMSTATKMRLMKEAQDASKPSPSESEFESDSSTPSTPSEDVDEKTETETDSKVDSKKEDSGDRLVAAVGVKWNLLQQSLNEEKESTSSKSKRASLNMLDPNVVVEYDPLHVRQHELVDAGLTTVRNRLRVLVKRSSQQNSARGVTLRVATDAPQSPKKKSKAPLMNDDPPITSKTSTKLTQKQIFLNELRANLLKEAMAIESKRHPHLLIKVGQAQAPIPIKTDEQLNREKLARRKLIAKSKTKSIYGMADLAMQHPHHAAFQLSTPTPPTIPKDIVDGSLAKQSVHSHPPKPIPVPLQHKVDYPSTVDLESEPYTPSLAFKNFRFPDTNHRSTTVEYDDSANQQPPPPGSHTARSSHSTRTNDTTATGWYESNVFRNCMFQPLRHQFQPSHSNTNEEKYSADGRPAHASTTTSWPSRPLTSANGSGSIIRDLLEANRTSSFDTRTFEDTARRFPIYSSSRSSTPFQYRESVQPHLLDPTNQFESIPVNPQMKNLGGGVTTLSLRPSTAPTTTPPIRAPASYRPFIQTSLNDTPRVQRREHIFGRSTTPASSATTTTINHRLPSTAHSTVGLDLKEIIPVDEFHRRPFKFEDTNVLFASGQQHDVRREETIDQSQRIILAEKRRRYEPRSESE